MTPKTIPTWALALIHYLLSQTLGVVRGNEAYGVLLAFVSPTMATVPDNPPSVPSAGPSAM